MRRSRRVDTGRWAAGGLREPPLSSRIVPGAVRPVFLAIVTFLAIIYLRLGYFVLFLLPLGAAASVLLTRRQRAGYPRVWSFLAAIALYGAAYALVSVAAIRNRDEMRDLRWEVLEAPGTAGAEVRLYLGEGDYLYSYSSRLASYLRSLGRGTVAVSLPVTRILGCFQSIGAPRIEGWGTAPLDGYASTGPGASPWEDHWWCP